jgi:parallel beta-helix repeat protein
MSITRISDLQNHTNIIEVRYIKELLPCKTVAPSGGVGDYVCDGTADDVQIQAAIDAANASGGGDVYIKAGTFNEATAIVPKSNVHIYGAGIGVTIIKQASGINSDVIAGSSVSNFSINNLGIDGNKANNATGDNGISLTNCNGIRIKNVSSYNNILKGINFTGGYNNKTIDCDLYDNDSNGVCYASNSGVGGAIYNCEANNCIVHACGGSGGITVITPTADYEHPQKIKILGNTVYDMANNVNCIDCKGGDGIQIIGNNTDTGANAIDLGATGIQTTNAVVLGNICKNGGGWGIVLENAANCLIEGNRLYDNQVVPTQDWGVYEYAASSNNTILNNDITDGFIAPNSGIYRGGTGTIVRNNKGYITENSGTATIASGQTTIVVTHGLATTPTADDIMVNPTNGMGNASKFWVNTLTSTQFTINVDVDPGADTATFCWKAIIL